MSVSVVLMRLTSLIFFACFFASPVCAETTFVPLDDVVPEVKTAKQDAGREKTTDIASRLASDKFFAGELADRLIDSGAYTKIIDAENYERAALRSALIFWIGKHPQSAAKLYQAYGGDKPAFDAPIINGKQPLQVGMEVRMNEHFLSLARSIRDKSGDKGTSDEDLSSAVSRLYDGPSEYDASYYVSPPAAGKAIDGGGFGAPISLRAPMDWKVDAKSVKNESTGLGLWLSGLKKEFTYDKTGFVAELGGHAFSELLANAELEKSLYSQTVFGKTIAQWTEDEFGDREKICSGAAAEERNFFEYAQRFIGRTSAGADEAKTLEQKRCAVRLRLAACHMRGRRYSLKSKVAGIDKIKQRGLLRRVPAKLLPGYAAAGELLSRRAAEVSGEYAALEARLGGDISLEEAFTLLSTLQKKEAQWTTGWMLWVKLPEIYEQFYGIWPSPLLHDALDYFLSKTNPANYYRQEMRRMHVYRQALDEIAAAVAEGDFPAAIVMLEKFSSSGNAQRALFELEYCIWRSAHEISVARRQSALVQFALFETPFYRPLAPKLLELMGDAAR